MYRYHGGRAGGNVIDFSVPINPLGPPKQILEILRNVINNIDIITRYPDYEYRDLRNSIASFYGVKSENIVPLNGAAEALYIILAVYRPRNLIAIEPTFGDYRLASYALKIPLISIPYIERGNEFVFPMDIISSTPRDIAKNSVIILSNPNNPTGCTVEARRIREVAEMFRDSLIVVDEAFIDLSEKFYESCLHLVEEYSNIVVVRSLTKTFSVPGLRIGFMYSSYSELFDLYRQPWNINMIADYIFTNVLRESGEDLKRFLEDSRRYISAERNRVAHSLRKLGFTVYNSHAPYILVRSYRYSAMEINNALMRYGICVRDASSYSPLTKYFFRIGIRNSDDNNHLIGVMDKLFGVDSELRKGY